MTRMLVIVGESEPLYEAEFTDAAPNEETAHLSHFIRSAPRGVFATRAAESSRLVQFRADSAVFSAFGAPGEWFLGVGAPGRVAPLSMMPHERRDEAA